ncbi:MAG: zinc transporter ZupT [Campylobacter sp.]|uniref:zinc transporter ZupT n=1 Tax=Campylobacter sp. TaxID=205 RepID=UPI002A83B22A|nr:zinc transporter ZupT [Campylobacter sp.]MCI7586700.1 zinc transporter ZupT [Campylobacter sp.]MDY5115439.1 zinc transporter ZupT [Campylobacter sp.]
MNFAFNDILFAFLLAIFAGASTCAGAAIAFFSKQDNTKMLSAGLGFSAGVMVYLSFVELLPASIEEFNKLNENGEIIALFIFFVSMLACLFIDKAVPVDINPHEIEAPEAYCELRSCYFNDRELCIAKQALAQDNAPASNKTLRRTGILTAFAIALHNFPEGFATFASGLESIKLGVVVALAVAIHNIPEGIAVSLPIYHATGQKRKAFIFAALSGLAEPLGALVGALLILPLFGASAVAVSFALVAGVMIFISFDQLFPVAKAYTSGHECLYGLIVGMAVMAFSLKLLSLI